MKDYDPDAFFAFLGFGPVKTYHCPGLRSLSVYCRGRREQLEALLEPTPFELADDRFLVSIADFSNVDNDSGKPRNPYYDAAVVLAVRYGDRVGGSYYFEWEDNHFSVAGGRELWGYPKRFAHISLVEDAAGAQGRVWLADHVSMEVDFVADDGVTNAAWSDVSFYPHLQARGVPEVNGPHFARFEIISRNTSLDYELLSRRYGRAEVRFGPEIQVMGEPLEIVESLGAELSVGNFASTRENGIPEVVASLV